MLYINYILMTMFLSASSVFSGIPLTEIAANAEKPMIIKKISDTSEVPFYSQFNDISSLEWKKIGCGIASLGMIVEYYNHNNISIDKLLNEGIESGAYLKGAGWIHNGLIKLSNNYGLAGKTVDLSSKENETAFSEFKEILKEGPIIVSVHYTFDPQNPIPHLVVINKIDGDIVYYNDPAETSGGKTISSEKLLNSWKQRFIVIRPKA